jgi:hypothetical protein
VAILQQSNVASHTWDTEIAGSQTTRFSSLSTQRSTLERLRFEHPTPRRPNSSALRSSRATGYFLFARANFLEKAHNIAYRSHCILALLHLPFRLRSSFSPYIHPLNFTSCPDACRRLTLHPPPPLSPRRHHHFYLLYSEASLSPCACPRR